MTREKLSFSEYGIHALGWIALIAGGLFLVMTYALSTGSLSAADSRLLALLRASGDAGDPLGPAWLEPAVRDITALGGNTVLILVTLGATMWLSARQERTTAWLLLLSVLAGVALSFALKAGLDRARPDVANHLQVVYTASFPSGHAMNATIVYLNLGLIVAWRQVLPAARAVAMLLTTVVILGVGMSRPYLGVHWVSDVLAGWLAGISWVCLCWWIAGFSGHRPG